MNLPSPSVTATLAPCAPVTVTATPGSGNPCASTIRPEIVPAVSCADALAAKAKVNSATTTPTQRFHIAVLRTSVVIECRSRRPGGGTEAAGARTLRVRGGEALARRPSRMPREAREVHRARERGTASTINLNAEAGLNVSEKSPYAAEAGAKRVTEGRTVDGEVSAGGARPDEHLDSVEHRRWMTRSIVLTFSVITNRVWSVVWVIVFIPQLNTTFGGNEQLMVQTIAGLSGWLGWVIPLVIAEWRLERRALTALTRADVNANRAALAGHTN